MLKKRSPELVPKQSLPSHRRRSVADVADRARKADVKARKTSTASGQAIVTRDEVAQLKIPTMDSFVNFAQKMGIGADNPLSSASYGFNPITRLRTILEWMYRGSWLAGVAVDAIAEDMTRGGVEIRGELEPKALEKIDAKATELGIWDALCENIKWGRLYGGSIAVMLIDGQALNTPLRVETIGRNQFKGLSVYDRWMLDPSLNDLVTDFGPDLGKPKYYTIVGDAPSLRNQKVHFSRCIRMGGIQLPWWQRIQENLWDMSVLERLYDRMIAFDSATTGAAQLVYRSYLRTYKIKDLRMIAAQGGDALNGLVAQLEIMRRFQGTEGITLLDMEDEFAVNQRTSFAGLDDILIRFGEQIAGAVQTPLVRLFGQSPAGLNSSGESDLRTYYDGIKKRQEREMDKSVTNLYKAIALSEGVRPSDGFGIEFRSLWELKDEEKAKIASDVVAAVTTAEEGGIISQATALKELRQSSRITGIFTNITDEDINAASEELPPTGEEAMKMQAELGQQTAGLTGEKKDEKALGSRSSNDSIEYRYKAIDLGGGVWRVAETANGRQSGYVGPRFDSKEAAQAYIDREKLKTSDHAYKRTDSIAAVAAMLALHGLPVVVELKKGELHRGQDHRLRLFAAIIAADYGYIRRTTGEDGMEVDCFIGPHYASQLVTVIHALDPYTGEPDEDKCMLGYMNVEAALQDFALSYDDEQGEQRIGSYDVMSMEQFKSWLGEAPRSYVF